MRTTKRTTQWMAMIAAMWFGPAFAADLKPETLQQWEEYVKTIDPRHQERLAPGTSFLASDQIPGRTAKLRAGEIVVAPAGPHVPIKVPSGLIHDWIGAVFIPNATLNDVLPVVRDCEHYKEFYHPNVADSKMVEGAAMDDRFSMVIMNKSVVARSALDADYRSSYTRVDERRWASVSDAIRIQEIAEYDTPAQHMLPEDHGTGLIWRLHSVTRFEERDGGVYIELEAAALSRDVPGALRFMIDPIIRKVSRSSMATSLQQTEAAVRIRSGLVTETAANAPAKRPAAAVKSFR